MLRDADNHQSIPEVCYGVREYAAIIGEISFTSNLQRHVISQSGRSAKGLDLTIRPAAPRACYGAIL
jgi:hypothetical protein